MKTILIILALLVPSVSFGAIESNLKYGQTSSAVVELQDFLYYKGFLKVNPTGFFGLLTLNAVKEYQTSVGVPNTGYVGVLTRGKINSELTEATKDSVQTETVEVGTTTVSTPTGVVLQGLQEIVNNPQTMSEVVLGTISEIREVAKSNPNQTKRYQVDVTKGDAKTILVETTSTAYPNVMKNIGGDDSFFFSAPSDVGNYTMKVTYYSDSVRSEGGQIVYPSQIIGTKTYSFSITE